jgi:hypothetical protein
MCVTFPSEERNRWALRTPAIRLINISFEFLIYKKNVTRYKCTAQNEKSKLKNYFTYSTSSRHSVEHPEQVSGITAGRPLA